MYRVANIKWVSSVRTLARSFWHQLNEMSVAWLTGTQLLESRCWPSGYISVWCWDEDHSRDSNQDTWHSMESPSKVLTAVPEALALCLWSLPNMSHIVLYCILLKHLSDGNDLSYLKIKDTEPWSIPSHGISLSKVQIPFRSSGHGVEGSWFPIVKLYFAPYHFLFINT